MLKSIIDFLIGREERDENKTLMNDLDRVTVATCALMLEMAYADDEFSQDEKETMLKALTTTYKINKSAALDLIRSAEKERRENIDLWQFTHKINEDYSKNEKLEVAQNLWKIIYSDGKVDKHEEYLMRKLTSLLNLSHGDMIQAKIDADGRS